jgi:two-component system cell cycle sensor histidine kinase PleC
VKFTPPNGRITLMCKQDLLNKKISIAVVDTGVCIAEKDISKVMAAFGQVKNEYSSKSEGTGLGLPLTRKLVELMDGHFVISSKLGEGTTVTLTFPYTGTGSA